MAMKPLVTPRVNTNGSSAADLIAQRMEVCRLLDRAGEAMAAAFPHGRDYQWLIKVGDWSDHRKAVEEAQDAFRERMQAIGAIKADFMNDAIAINRQSQGKGKLWAAGDNSEGD